VTAAVTDDEQRRRALAEFLRARRARLSPAQVGLPEGGRRRTPGLRREEVAQRAEVSVAYYTWLEQARDLRASREVLHRVADALLLNADERAHLFLLADQSLVSMPPLPTETVDPALRYVLDNQGPNPAYVLGRRCDLLAWNRAACAVFGDFEALPPQRRNMVRFIFTDPAFRARVVDWEGFAREALGVLRAKARHHVGDPSFARLCDDVRRVSPEFQPWWPQHDVRETPERRWDIDHPLVGRLTLDVAILQVMGDADLKVCLYTAPPGSETATKLHDLRIGSGTRPHAHAHADRSHTADNR